jgi:hypothetical protein
LLTMIGFTALFGAAPDGCAPSLPRRRLSANAKARSHPWPFVIAAYAVAAALTIALLLGVRTMRARGSAVDALKRK